MPPNSAKHVFMSYSRKDKEIMQRIVDFLRKQEIDMWVDSEYLVPGTRVWEEEIEKAIHSSMALTVICSPDSKQSEWVRREITYAQQYGKYIIPLLVSGNTTTSITLALITYQYLDLRSSEKIGLNQLSILLRKQKEEIEKLEQTQDPPLHLDSTEYTEVFKELFSPVKSRAKENDASEIIDNIDSLQEVLRSIPNLPYLPIMTFLEVYSYDDMDSRDRLRLLLIEYRKRLMENMFVIEARNEPVAENLQAAIQLIDKMLGIEYRTSDNLPK